MKITVWSDDEICELMGEAIKEENPYLYALSKIGCEQEISSFHATGLAWNIGECEELHTFIRFVELMHEAKKGPEIFDAGRETAYIEMGMPFENPETSTKH